jgi:acetyl-CoA carboxylase carboxyltransferase component
MGGEQAAKTLQQIQVASMKGKGMEVTAEDEKKLLDEITQKYLDQTSPYYAAARLWVDAIIDPLDTRNVVSAGISAANQQPLDAGMKVGVFQV